MVSTFGRDAVRVETVDGKLILVPLAWTSMRPRPSPLELKGQSVRLAADALRELAAWVAARTTTLQPHKGKKFAAKIGKRDKKNNGEHCSSGSGSVAAVVEQAGSPDADCRDKQRERGKR